MKKFTALFIATILMVVCTLTVSAAPTTNPNGGNLETIISFDDQTDLSKIEIQGDPYTADVDFRLELKNDGGESGKCIRYTNLNATSGTSAFIPITLDLAKLGVNTDWSEADEVWIWETNDFAAWAGTYFQLQVVLEDGKIFTIKGSDPFKYGSQETVWASGNASYGILTAIPANAANWVRISFKDLKYANEDEVITKEQLKTVKAIKLMVPVNAFFPDQGITFDSIGLFTADPQVTETEPKVPFQDEVCNDTFIKADTTVTETKVLIGGEEFENGTQLGVAESEPIGFMSDNMAGTFYNLIVKDDGKGNEGKYFEFTAKDVPAFSYTNQILQLVKFDRQPTDWTDYDEMLVWVDVTGFGPQYEGTDFSIQAYEIDYDGDTELDTFERWAVKQGKPVYLQDGDKWKAVNAHEDMLIRLEKDFKGWIRIPFDSMSVVEVLGAYNRTFDRKKVLSIVTGIPDDINRIGYSMKLDSIMLAKTTGTPDLEAAEIDLTPKFNDEIANAVDDKAIMTAIEKDMKKISVNVKDVTEVSGDLFASMAGKDVNLKIGVCRDGHSEYEILLNGKNITGDTMADLTLRLAEEAEQAEKALKKAGDDKAEVFSVAENDPFPGKLTYTIPTALTDKLRVYRYDTDTDQLTEGEKELTAENGKVAVDVNVGGTYVVMDAAVQGQDGEGIPSTGDPYSGWACVVVLMMIAGTVALTVGKRMKA